MHAWHHLVIHLRKHLSHLTHACTPRAAPLACFWASSLPAVQALILLVELSLELKQCDPFTDGHFSDSFLQTYPFLSEAEDMATSHCGRRTMNVLLQVSQLGDLPRVQTLSLIHI